MIERSHIQILAGEAGEFSSPGSTFCADSDFSIRTCVTAVAPVILPKVQVAGYI